MANVLIVEDDAGLRMTYKLVLQSEGHHILEAPDGTEALKVISEHKPDVILLDINMPNMDGITFLKKANLPKSLPDAKVIVFSNLEETEKLNEAYGLGAMRYVLKASVSPKELSALVKNILK